MPQTTTEYEMAERKLPQVSMSTMLKEAERDDRSGFDDDDEPVDPTLSTSVDRFQVRALIIPCLLVVLGLVVVLVGFIS